MNARIGPATDAIDGLMNDLSKRVGRYLNDTTLGEADFCLVVVSPTAREMSDRVQVSTSLPPGELVHILESLLPTIRERALLETAGDPERPN